MVLAEGQERRGVVLSIESGGSVRGKMTGLLPGEKAQTAVIARGAKSFYAETLVNAKMEDL